YYEKVINGIIYSIFAEVNTYWNSSFFLRNLESLSYKFSKRSIGYSVVKDKKVPTTIEHKKEKEYVFLKQPIEKNIENINNINPNYIDPECIENIFIRLKDSNLFSCIYAFFITLLHIPELCTSVLNKKIINILYFKKNLESNTLIASGIAHTFTILVYNEIINENILTLDINDVCDLPKWNIDIENNPYIPYYDLPYIDHLKKCKIPRFHYYNNNRGIYNFEEFKKRFDKFTNGIFENINWDKIYISGSIIPACVFKSPLENMFNNLEDYFNEYYPSKEILKNVDNLTIENIMNVEDLLSDIDIIIDDNINFELKIQRLVNEIKENLLKIHNKQSFTDKEFMLLKINRLNSHKYYLSGTALPRSLEIFHFNGRNVLTSIKRFHLPCVRGFYDGKSVKLFPSAVCTAYSGIISDYNFYRGKNYIDVTILLKYYIRGFSLLANENEVRIIEKEISEFPDIYKYNFNNGLISYNHPIFKPRKNCSGYYVDLDNYGYNKIDNYNFVEEKPIKKNKFLIRKDKKLLCPSWSFVSDFIEHYNY
ncbi:MAG: hypothetical protein QW303_01720, partial [Nitrososphaerota archaeon]